MFKENLEKYYNDYYKIVNTNNDKKEIFELAIEFLNSKDLDRPVNFFFSEFSKIDDVALNSARQYIDELIEKNKFKKARIFSQQAKEKLFNIDISPLDEKRKKQRNNEIGNFFEVYDYRIIDRKYIYYARKKIEEVEKRSENKIYEILTIFVTIIAIIFSFVNGGSVNISNFEIPSFIFLSATIVFSWLLIKILNSKIK